MAAKADAATISTHDYLQGNFAPVRKEHVEAASCEIIEGAIPEGLVGSSYVRNGPNPKHIWDGMAYHWFDGDGMLHLLNIESTSNATFRNRYINNPQVAVEDQLGFGLRPSIATFLEPMTKGSLVKMVAKGALAKATLGSQPITTSNTALVYHHSGLMALNEANPPMKVQLPTLDSMGLETYGEKLSRFTAHPKVDPETDEMVFFGYDVKPQINYYVADKDGNLVINTKVQLKDAIMMHDFVVTRTRSLIIDNPIVFSIPGIDPKANPSKNAILSFRRENGSRIAIIPRHYNEAKDNIQWIDIDTCSVIHTAGAWDLAEENGRWIAYVAPRMTEVELRALSGRGVKPQDPAKLHMWLIDTQTGSAVERCLDESNYGEFPVINPTRVTKPLRYVWVARFADEDPRKFDGIIKYDLGEGMDTLAVVKDLVDGKRQVTAKVFKYGGKRFSGEAVFAPRYAGRKDPVSGKELDEDDGYLVCFVHDEAQGENEYDGFSEFWIIDAKNMEDVVCKIRLPCRVPYGFHGLFVDPEQMRMQKVVEKNLYEPGIVSRAIASVVGMVASML